MKLDLIINAESALSFEIATDIIVHRHLKNSNNDERYGFIKDRLTINFRNQYDFYNINLERVSTMLRSHRL